MEDTPVKRGKQRSIEALHDIPSKEMSPEELKKYIDHLREEVSLLTNQKENLDQIYQATNRQKQEAAQKYSETLRAYKGQIQFCKDTVAQAYKTLHYMAPVEED